MNKNECDWVEQAVQLCANGNRNNVAVLFVRRQDCNEEADVAVTNAITPEMLGALYGAIKSGTGNDDE